MSIADRSRRRKAQADISLSEARTKIQQIERRIRALENAQQYYDTPTWQWLVSVFLPCEMERINHEDRQNDPEDNRAKLLAQGAYDECVYLTNTIAHVRRNVKSLRKSLDDYRKREAELLRRQNG